MTEKYNDEFVKRLIEVNERVPKLVDEIIDLSRISQVAAMGVIHTAEVILRASIVKGLTFKEVEKTADVLAEQEATHNG